MKKELRIKPSGVSIIIVRYENSVFDVCNLFDNVVYNVQFLEKKDLNLSTEVILVDQSNIEFNFEDLRKINNIFSKTEIAFNYKKEPYNLGHSHGANIGAKISSNDTLWFLSPDAIILPSTLYEGLTSVDNNFGIVESRQFPLEHPKYFNIETGETYWATGASFFVFKNIFQQINGFDEYYFPQECNDVDFSLRARWSGTKIKYNRSSIVVHLKPIKNDAKSISYSSAQLFTAYLGRLNLISRYGTTELLTKTLSLMEQRPLFDLNLYYSRQKPINTIAFFHTKIEKEKFFEGITYGPTYV